MTGMALMYGTPPAEKGWGRETGKAEQIAKALESFTPATAPAPGPAPEHHRITWCGAELVWDTRCFQGSGDGWAAQVFPDGVRWKADLLVCGGRREGFGLTPAEALDEARTQWQVAVAKLGGEP